MKDPYLQEWLLTPDGIATQLRKLRGARTGKEFAETAGMRPAKLSKLELGQQVPTETDVRQVVAAAGGDQTTADNLVAKLRTMPTVRTEGERLLRFGQVAAQRRLNERLASATHVRIFESLFIPRPLQDTDYAEVMLSQLGRETSAEETAQAAAVLSSSSQYLYDPARKVEIVLAEPVLRWQSVKPAVLNSQLERILTAAALPNVTISVLPLATPIAVHPARSFAVYDAAVYLDSLDEGAEMTGVVAAHHLALMERLVRGSLSPSKSRALIRAASVQSS